MWEWVRDYCATSEVCAKSRDISVAVRLAGDGDLESAPAGKPCCYGTAAMPRFREQPDPVAAGLARGSDPEAADAGKPDCYASVVVRQVRAVIPRTELQPQALLQPPASSGRPC
jgi:hypothetical protein